MSRSAGRWLVLGILLAAVIALGIYNASANHRLVEGLTNGTASAFEELSSRQDAYIFLQAEEPETRRQIAVKLGSWQDARAVNLIVTLLPDPDAAVRMSLVDSLAAAATREPKQLAAALSSAPGAAVSALIEAATRQPMLAREILELTIEANRENINAYLLAKRIGLPSKPYMIEVLQSGSQQVVLYAADVLAGLPLDRGDRTPVGEAIYKSYARSKDRAYKDKLLPLMAEFAPVEALSAFREVALDQTAPSGLRVAATGALVALDDTESLQLLRGDADTNVAAVLKTSPFARQKL